MYGPLTVPIVFSDMTTPISFVLLFRTKAFSGAVSTNKNRITLWYVISSLYYKCTLLYHRKVIYHIFLWTDVNDRQYDLADNGINDKTELLTDFSVLFQ